MERTSEGPPSSGVGAASPRAPGPSPPTALRRSRTATSFRGDSGGRRARPHSLDRPVTSGTTASNIVAQGRSLSTLRPLTSQPVAPSRKLARGRRASSRGARPTTAARLPDLVPACDRAPAGSTSSGSTAGEEVPRPAGCSCGEKARLSLAVDALTASDAKLEIRGDSLLVAGDRALRSVGRDAQSVVTDGKWDLRGECVMGFYEFYDLCYMKRKCLYNFSFDVDLEIA